tara:strand:- start:316 stop:561 length:246 start_codon:yes stop_codon:yes gene_type:complete
MIKKGTPCFLTQLGHNNFHYPVYSDEGLTYFDEDVDDFQLKAWVCGRDDLAAVVVAPAGIRDLYGSGNTVVWIEKKHLKDT